MSDGWNFKTGNPEYERYIHSAEWRKKADARLETDDYTCCVCGKEATDVHHLTYDRFRHEEMEDLVSLCRRCHQKAEEIYDPKLTPWAMNEIKPNGNNFMAAMRVDALFIAPVVYDYLMTICGRGFDSLMRLRQPDDEDGKKYWRVLNRVVNALCRKRYSRNCVEDRTDIMLGAITNHMKVICLNQIEHYIRNKIQASLHETVAVDYAIFEKWKDVADSLGITAGTLKTLRDDDGKSFGPSLREAVLYYCGLDAAAGIYPAVKFQCLTETDYAQLNAITAYMNEVSGCGVFKGEYTEEVNRNA